MKQIMPIRFASEEEKRAFVTACEKDFASRLRAVAQALYEREDVRTYAHSQKRYRKWKDQTLAYYSGNQMTYEEPEELDPEIRMQKRKEYLQHIFDEQEE